MTMIDNTCLHIALCHCFQPTLHAMTHSIDMNSFNYKLSIRIEYALSLSLTLFRSELFNDCLQVFECYHPSISSVDFSHVDDPSTYILTGIQFRDCCFQNVRSAERILDRLLDSQRSFPDILERHLTTIRSYFSGERTFEEFSREGSEYFH